MTNDIIENSTGNLPTDMEVPTGISPRKNSLENMLFDTEYFEKLRNVAGVLEKSNFVPKHYRNRADCFIALHMAYSAGIDPMFLLQNTYVVHGTPGWSGQAIIALINNSGRYAKNLNWEFARDNKGEVIQATCYTTDKDGERVEASINWAMVTGENWDRNTKWKNMREQMFCYRSATFFARRYCPDILLGIATADEQADIKDITPTGKSDKADALNAMAVEPAEAETVPLGDATVPLEPKEPAKPSMIVIDEAAKVPTPEKLAEINKASEVDEPPRDCIVTSSTPNTATPEADAMDATKANDLFMGVK